MIVGAGAAGLGVAEGLRRGGHDGPVVLIGEEPVPPYDRPPLSKDVLTGRRDADTALRPPAALEKLGLDLRVGTRADGVDLDARKVLSADGTTVDFDQLVITTGVRPRALPGAGFHTLRSGQDAVALRDALAPGVRLAIVGGGFLGAEVAASARTIGAEVTLISDLDAPLEDVIGAGPASWLLGVHADRGVDVRTGSFVEEVVADGVRLRGGEEIQADVVLVAIGCVPNTEWLEGSGVPLEDGVSCDEHLCAADGVWAAGDVARFRHADLDRSLRVEHRTHAAESGMAVARNLLAGDEAKPFTPTLFVWSDQYDHKLHVLGLPDGCPDRAEVERDGSTVTLYGDGEVVRGAFGVDAVRAVRGAGSLIGTPWADTVR